MPCIHWTKHLFWAASLLFELFVGVLLLLQVVGLLFFLEYQAARHLVRMKLFEHSVSNNLISTY
jgi:hypothetical protein